MFLSVAAWELCRHAQLECRFPSTRQPCLHVPSLLPYLPFINLQVVSVTMPLAQQAGYYCNVCDCILRDSQSYLDHINGGAEQGWGGVGVVGAGQVHSREQSTAGAWWGAWGH